MFTARKKHQELDEKLKKEAAKWLEKSLELKLSSDEKDILKIIKEHKHPRRQLFWAYRSKDRYQKLKDFFSSNEKAMLPITSSGTIIKKT